MAGVRNALAWELHGSRELCMRSALARVYLLSTHLKHTTDTNSDNGPNQSVIGSSLAYIADPISASIFTS